MLFLVVVVVVVVVVIIIIIIISVIVFAVVQIDSIVDTVGVVVALELLGVERVYCSEIPLGCGTVR